jgi:ribosomal protein S18 acetylase RimI-like enzyme
LTITVRAATANDAGPIVQVAVRSWDEGFRGIVPPEIDSRRAWDSDGVRARLLDEGRETEHAVGELDGMVRGYIVHGPSRDRDAPSSVGEIWALYVHPEVWRRGIGRALVEHALAELRAAGYRETTLWTLAGSPSARAFYEACGFERDGAEQRRPSFGSPLEIRYGRSLGKNSR